MDLFKFFERYKERELYRDYERAGKDVEAYLRRSAPGMVALDFRGIKFLGYSYAKSTVVRALRLASSGEIEDLRVIAITDSGLSLEELEVALERFDLALIVLSSGEEEYAEGIIVGKLPEYLRSTWDVLAGLGPSTTAEVAEKIGESLQNTNQRLKRLNTMGLISREKVMSPTGGREWLNKVS